MPSNSGVSIDGPQTLLTGLTITQQDFIINFPSANPAELRRVGFGYVIGGTITATNNLLLFERQPIYLPGAYIPFFNRFGPSGQIWALVVDWNQPGLSWTATYF